MENGKWRMENGARVNVYSGFDRVLLSVVGNGWLSLTRKGGKDG